MKGCGKSRHPPVPGFDPRTGCPVVIRYTVYAVPVHSIRIQKYVHEFCVYVSKLGNLRWASEREESVVNQHN